MGTLTAKAILTSSNITSSNLSISKSPVLTVSGDVNIRRVKLSTTTAKILESDDYGHSYIWLFNTEASGGATITIGEDAAAGASMDETHMTLAPGEWAFWPSNTDVDLWADASADTPVLEVGIFEKA